MGGWRVLRIILKVLGMAIVILSCVNFIREAAIVKAVTGNADVLIKVLLVSAVFVWWAWGVIWTPIPKPGQRV